MHSYFRHSLIALQLARRYYALVIMGKYSKKLMVLFVDSDERSLALYRAVSLDEGIDCAIADSAEAAMETLKANRPDSIILDMHLPGISGLAFCLRLKNARLTKGIPIGIILSRPEDRMQIGSLSLSADELLYKPLTPVDLKTRLRNLLGLSHKAPPSA